MTIYAVSSKMWLFFPVECVIRPSATNHPIVHGCTDMKKMFHINLLQHASDSEYIVQTLMVLVNLILKGPLPSSDQMELRREFQSLLKICVGFA